MSSRAGSVGQKATDANIPSKASCFTFPVHPRHVRSYAHRRPMHRRPLPYLAALLLAAAELGCPGRPTDGAARPGSRTGVTATSAAATSAAATSRAPAATSAAATSHPSGSATSAPSAPPLAESPPVRRATGWSAPKATPAQRSAGAQERRRQVVEQLFTAATVPFPPRQLLLRGFKREARLEVWASGEQAGPLSHVTTYEICYGSGELGPKRKEGDLQVPEGFYQLDAFNAASRFHLSMQVSYPSRSDRILGDRREPGGEIMIHGHCVSAGCLAMTDERIEELWVMTTALRDRGGRVQVHLLPSRDLRGLIASQQLPQHRAFWENLLEGHERFERTRTSLSVRVDGQGRYRFD